MPYAASPILPHPSLEFAELQQLFENLAPPYGAEAISGFSRTYKRIYHRLSLAERRRAEDYVDQLIAGIERKELAERIFGVV